jgi:TonB family protein
VEGTVTLYAVIRADGTVDGIKVLGSLDERLDANAMRALSGWRFRPGTKNGEPVALEAVVQIPFRMRHLQ